MRKLLDHIIFVKQLSLKFKSNVSIVTKRRKQIDFLPKNPLNGIQLRLDVVQSTFNHPIWCSDMWLDLYLPIRIIRYLHAFFGGKLQINLSNGDMLQDINSYENKITPEVANQIEYDDLIEATEIEHVSIGEDVKIYVNDTYSFLHPYEDAITYSICVNGFKENDYTKLAKCLKDFLKDDYRIEII